MPRSRIIFVAILAIAVLIVAGFSLIRPQIEQNQASQNATAVASDIVTIDVNYGTEKKLWLEAVTSLFQQQNPNIRVRLVGQGSMSAYQDLSQARDAQNTLAGNKPIPALWSPAAEIQVNLLNSVTQNALNRPLATECKRMLLSPLAIMMWEDRAKAFEAHYQDKGGITFANLADALSGSTQGKWSALGGDSDWGLIKIGYTDPSESNSGTMMLMALANNYYQKTARITVQELSNDDYVKSMTSIINAVTQPLLSSSGVLMEDFIAKGPSSYDIVVVYEALAIEHFKNAIGRHQIPLRIIYPTYNLYSDHPMCLIDHPSVTPAQREAALEYQAFLLSAEAQKLALQYGYRPADLSIPLFGANTVFDDPQMKAAGLGAKIGQELVVPDGNTINQMITIWRRNFVG
jgi:Ca-activated chloride channel homolog